MLLIPSPCVVLFRANTDVAGSDARCAVQSCEFCLVQLRTSHSFCRAKSRTLRTTELSTAEACVHWIGLRNTNKRKMFVKSLVLPLILCLCFSSRKKLMRPPYGQWLTAHCGVSVLSSDGMHVNIYSMYVYGYDVWIKREQQVTVI